MGKSFLFLLLGLLIMGTTQVKTMFLEEGEKYTEKVIERGENSSYGYAGYHFTNKPFPNTQVESLAKPNIIPTGLDIADPSEALFPFKAEQNANLSHIPPSRKKMEEMAGKPRGIWSSTYNKLLAALDRYEALPKTASIEKRLACLENISEVAQTYLSKKQASLFKEGINVYYSPSDIERAKSRIEACALLLNGVEIERSNLASGEKDDQPRKGVRLDRTGLPIDYQKNFAAGNFSSLALIKIGEKKNLFKASTNKKLPELVAEQFGFPDELIRNGGVSEIMANLSGRELATYKIAKELSKSTGIKLVPDVIPAALGNKPHQITGNALEFIEGSQLCKDHFIPVSEEELESLFSGQDSSEKKALIRDYMAEAACALIPLPSEWRLLFPTDFLEQRSSEEPLYEEGKPISRERALELTREDFFSFEKREIFSINHDINFRQPLLQKILNQIHLLLLLTGELDPNELNFIFFKDQEGLWRAVSIDHDLSFSRLFSDVSDEVIDSLSNQKEAKNIVKTPLLVDQKMGDTLLALTPEELHELLKGTHLSPLEVEACQNRLKRLQQLIQQAKEEGHYVFDPIDQKEAEGEKNQEDLSTELEETAAISETEVPLKKERLYWGEKTYEMQKEDPERSYLGKFLKTKENLIQKLESTLQIKINQQQQKIEEEKQKLNDLLAHLERIRTPQKQQENGISSLLQTQNEVTASHRHHRSYSTASNETAETLLTSLLPNLRRATTEFLCKNFLLLQKELENRQVMPSSSFFNSFLNKFLKNRLLLEDEKQQKAIFKTNQLLSEAAKAQKEVEPLFEKLIEEILFSSDSSNHYTQWEKCLQQLDHAYTSLNFALTAFEEETGILPEYLLPERKSYQEKAQHDKEKVLSNILWCQIYQTEQQAAATFRKEKSHSEEYLRSLLEAQQAWRALFSNIPTLSEEHWRPQVTKAKRLEIQQAFTPFFTYSLGAAEKRHQTLNSVSNIDRSIKNSEEKNHWNDFHSFVQNEVKDPKSTTESELWKSILKELDFQKMYTSAEQDTIATDGLKEDISKLLSGEELVYTKVYPIQEKRLFSTSSSIEDIDGVNLNKLQELCNLWDTYKRATLSMKKSWSTVVEYAEKELPRLSNNLRNEKALEEQNKQALEALFQTKAQQALNLGNIAEAIFLITANTSRPPEAILHRLEEAISTYDLDSLHHELSKARAEINNALRLSELSETGMWRPPFPRKKLNRLEEIKTNVENQATEREFSEQPKESINKGYIIFNLHNEEIMRSFLNQIDTFLDDYSITSSDHSKIKELLIEMITGEPDFIKEARNLLIKKLHELKDSIYEKLEMMED